MKAATFKTVNKGFIKNVTYLENGVSYVKEFAATGRGSEAEVDYTAISNWADILP